MAHHLYAGVAELADAPDLGSGAARRGGSSPFTRTFNELLFKCRSSSVVEYNLAGVAELADAQDLKSCGR